MITTGTTCPNKALCQNTWERKGNHLLSTPLIIPGDYFINNCQSKNGAKGSGGKGWWSLGVSRDYTGLHMEHLCSSPASYPKLLHNVELVTIIKENQYYRNYQVQTPDLQI
jgi:hypothetical protein